MTAPRATDGDFACQPDWQERVSLTVGTDKADLVGSDERVLQAALDYVARLGGGTVTALPGTYRLRNAVFLPARTRLIGSGRDTILTKGPSFSTPLVDDSDWYDQEITLQDASGFRVGDGVVLRATHAHSGWPIFLKRTIVARSGNRCKLNVGLRENLWLRGTPDCISLFPLLTSDHTADIVIENLSLDGNRENNEPLDGNFGGCIFIQDCNRCVIRGVEARSNNGDGISFQICHDTLLEDCYSHNHGGFGVHPGSGSQRPIIRNCRMERNEVGLFICWGVRNGLVEGNRIDGNHSAGFSIGHNYTDNMIRDNDVLNSGEVGMLFRNEPQGRDFGPNRNTLSGNRITNNGGPSGIAIDLQGHSHDIRILDNQLRETRGTADRTGIHVAEVVGQLEMARNELEGFARPLHDERWA